MADEVSESKKESSALSRFLTWCKDNNLILNDKVKVCKKGSCHRYGMIAIQDIDTNECLFSIPRKLLLEPKTSSVANIINDLDENLSAKSSRGSGWVPLLLTLMYEFTNHESLWRPYLDIIPSLDILDQPVFWSVEDRERLLKDTEIADDVKQDLKCIEKEYNGVVTKFIKKHKEKFSLKTHTMNVYKHMAAFIMAYSFTENGPHCYGDNTPVMVPMADILNHHSNNNAHLEFAKEELRMVSTQPIAKGQEVFNTYGQLANWHLLQSYGFVEATPNPNDTIEISVAMFYEVLQTQATSKHQSRILDGKFQFMEEMGIISSEDGFVFDLIGCQTDETTLTFFLKFVNLSEQDLQDLLTYENKEGNRGKSSSDIAELISYFDQCTAEQKLSSYKSLEMALKSNNKKRTKNEAQMNRTQSKHETAPKRHKMDTKASAENDYYGNQEDEINKGSYDNDEEDDDIDSVGSSSISSDNDDCDVDSDDNIDNSDDTNDNSDDDNVDDDDNAVNGTSDADDVEEDEQFDHMTYEQMSHFPLKWRKMLSSVAKDCSRRIDVLLQEKLIHQATKSLTCREQSVRHILTGLRDILHQVVKLDTSDS